MKDLTKCNDLIIILNGQINFIRDLISEKLSLGVQFGLNKKIDILEIKFIFLLSWLIEIRG